ncbi:MAG: SGNH/GDSL hydrolase family protein [Devosia sp.]
MRWIASWTAAPMSALVPGIELTSAYGQTIREIARLTISGSKLVLRLTNEFGRSPVTLDSVELAMAGEAGSIEPMTTRPVTFGGKRGAVIHGGTPLLSDPIEMEVSALSRLAVSYFCSGHLPLHTTHWGGRQSSFVSVPGDFTTARQMMLQQTTGSHHLLSALYVLAPSKARAIICVGDSITDGDGSTVDADRRWPDILAERLQQSRGFESVAVLNQGIGGNRILFEGSGEKLLQRFDRDVLTLHGATHVVVLCGVNDIAYPATALAGPAEAVTTADIIAALAQLVIRARLAGLKVLLGTILPFEGALPATPIGYYTTQKDRTRQAVNQWIREGSTADGIIDFDAVIRDPDRPTRILPRYDSGDSVHPGDAGYRAMANAIDLTLLR